MICRIALAFIGLLVASVFAQSQHTSSEPAVREALVHFLRAFDDLDWDRFRLAFDDHATVFYPRAIPRRANGRAEFEKGFKNRVRVNSRRQTSAPYMDIQPKEMRIQVFGDVAIATFHLEDRAGFINRRTIVLEKTEKGWKIVHLHASEVSVTCGKP